MNTYDIDIELPPLPSGYKSYEFPDGGYDADEMQAYARAAIEPYKQRISELEAQLEAVGAGGVSSQRITSQRRGEPVAFAKDGNLFWCGDPVAWREFSGELYLAPQPAEPAKVSSDLPHALRDLVAIWRKQQGEYPAEGKQAAAAVRLCANELELLLSRYGHPVEPEGWRLVPKELIDFLDAKEHHLPVEDRHVLSIMLEAAPKFGEEEWTG